MNINYFELAKNNLKNHARELAKSRAEIEELVKIQLEETAQHEEREENLKYEEIIRREITE